MLIKYLKYFGLLLLVNSCLIAQLKFNYVTKTDTFVINLQNKYILKSISILPLSEKVWLNSKQLTKSDYSLDLKENSLSLNSSVNFSLFDTIIVKYKYVPLSLKKEYKNREYVKVNIPNLNSNIYKVKEEKTDLSTDAIIGNNLKSSGTLLRGISVGTNKDLNVNSGLRLQLSGKVTDDIEVIAALTDENTPIQPEGNSERLEELDKVYIEIKHKYVSGVFGDYDYKTSVGNFGKVERKLQGVSGKFNYKNHEGSIAFAASRGKFNSMNFSGIDGVQGPYRLLGTNGENDIIIIAGSEKVYLDGKLLKRGENNDYTIEYSNAEVSFTPKQLITSLSRIVVDYEYTTRRYERNLLGATYSTNLFENKVSISLNAVQEGDNKKNPIDVSLSDEDKIILKQSGDDQFNAALDGAYEVLDDSIGVYEKIDSLINGVNKTIYKYNPGSINAKYNVSFSYVGQNNGEYKRVSIGNYLYVGINNGEYLPIRLLPLPEKNQLANIVLGYKPTENISFSLELAANSYDRNTFSTIDDGDNNGFARLFKLNVLPSEINLFGKGIGKVSTSILNRFKDSRFVPIDRINEVEYGRNYNVASESGQENLTEVNINYKPHEKANFKTTYGNLKKGSDFQSSRFFTQLDLTEFNNISVNYVYDNVSTESSYNKTDWLKQQGKVSYNIFNIQPGFEFRSENKKDFYLGKDSLTSSSLEFYEYSPLININILKGFNLSAKYTFTDERSPVKGKLIPEAKSYAHVYGLSFKSIKQFSSTIDFAFRKKKYSDYFLKKGLLNNESVQIRSINKLNLFNRFVDGTIYYQASSERTAKLERVFIRVQKGTGSYIYSGDTNENGIADESEFIPDLYEGDFIQATVPTDELFPVIDVNLNARLKLTFEKLKLGRGLFAKLFNPISTETTVKVEENSTDENTNNIYFLRFSKYLNKENTIRGFNFFQHDLHLFKNNRELSFRFRFSERKSLSQFSGGLEQSYNKHRSVKIKFRMIEEINNETEYINSIENVSAPEVTKRSRKIISDELTSDFSYRPYRNFEMGFLFSVSQLTDNYPKKPTKINQNKIVLRLTLSLLDRGRLRLEGERTEFLVNNNDNFIPFEITNGNLVGKNYIWRVNFDYRFSSNLQANVNYFGRQNGSSKTIHTLTAEARAYF